MTLRLMAAVLLLAAAPAALAAQDRIDRSRPTAVLVSGPDVGRKAPEFRLPWATKDTTSARSYSYDLRSDRGKVVVLAFYPADFTQGCTAELRSFAQRYDELFGDGVTVLGISADSLATHQQFARSLDLPFRLLSDPDQRVARDYGSNGPNGRMRRTVYVLGPDGRVVYRDLRFGALDPKAYDRLAAAVKRAKASGR